MITTKHVYTILAVLALAYWSSPLLAQVGLEPGAQTFSAADIKKPPLEGQEDTAVNGGDTANNGVTTIAGIERQTLIQVYPNPAGSRVMIMTPNSEPVYLYTHTGKLLGEYRSNVWILIGELSPGIYLVRTGQSSTRLVVNGQ